MTAAILPFPPRNKGRIRRSRSPEAMGRCSLSLLERNGRSLPANIADIRSAHESSPVDDGRLALRLSLAIFATLSGEQKAKIRTAVKSTARHDDNYHGDECRALYPYLTGEQLRC